MIFSPASGSQQFLDAGLQGSPPLAAAAGVLVAADDVGAAVELFGADETVLDDGDPAAPQPASATTTAPPRVVFQFMPAKTTGVVNHQARQLRLRADALLAIGEVRGNWSTGSRQAVEQPSIRPLELAHVGRARRRVLHCHAEHHDEDE
jgi:hypothetical protein